MTTPQNTKPARLYRSRDDRVIAGVAGGIARHLGVDPVLVRLATVALALAAGSGILAYLIAWVIIPEAPRSGEDDYQSRTGNACARIGPNPHDRGHRPGRRRSRPCWHEWAIPSLDEVFWPLVVIAIGGSPADPRGEAMTDDSPTTDPFTQDDERSGLGLGQIVSGALLVMLGVAWLIEAAGWADVPWRGLLAGALIMVGAALMFGARSGSHGGLIAFGMGLAVVLALSSAIAVLADIPLSGGFGEERLRPAAVVEDEYHWGIGSMTLDLRGTTGDLAGREITASVAIGELIVYVPEGVDVTIDAHVGIGEARCSAKPAAASTAGVQVSGGPGALVLDLDVAIGKVEVRR